MSAVVVNHLHLSVPVDGLVPDVEREFGPVLRDQPGFEHLDLVKAAEREAIAVIVWRDEEASNAGAAVIEPSLLARHLAPVLAAPQERSVGPAVVEVGPDR